MPIIGGEEAEVTSKGTVLLIEDEEAIREHAQKGGFPADRISEVKAMIDQTTAET